MPRGLKYAISSLLIGALSVGLAWAGAIITPPTASDVPGGKTSSRSAVLASLTDTTENADGTFELDADQVLAGAAKASIEPRPKDWDGDENAWAKEGCKTLGGDFGDSFDHIFDTRVKWVENTNCIYSGGFGLGPMNPLTEWDQEYGLWVRSVAISDGADTAILTILDGAYYFGHNRDMCSPNQDCGFFDLADTLGAELGLDPKSFLFASTHAHSSPDFIGAWGGVPRWYMNQVTDALLATVRAAVSNMAPARIEAGEELARQFSNERRDHYRSAEEYGLTWIRLIGTGEKTPDLPIDYSCTIDCPAAESGSEGGDSGATSATRRGSQQLPVPQTTPGCKSSGNKPKKCPTPTPTPEPSEEPTAEPTEEPTAEPTPEPEPTASDELRAIATIGAFAAHPTNKGAGPLAHADFAGPYEKRVEDLWGGVGLFFQTGLGNVSSSGGGHPEGDERVEQMGFGLASLMPSLAGGRVLTNGEAPLDLVV
ncbi:MAG: hypothetical protein ACRDJ5_00490, partial [Actinomycetota bacterium]